MKSRVEKHSRFRGKPINMRLKTLKSKTEIYLNLIN